jgi:hypothetical protein
MEKGEKTVADGAALTRRGQALAAAGDDAARCGGAGGGEEEYLVFRVRAGVGAGSSPATRS